MNDEIIVSICCTTFNHGNFIKYAIEGFLMQKTDFPIEILIHDDASTDGTTEIIKKYENEYPDLIHAVYQTENQYSQGKKVFPILANQARGKYIALCEGDDYWIDAYKLQKQVNFLNSHPEYVMVSHNALKIYEKENFEQAHLVKNFIKPFDFNQRDLMIKNRCITCTVMFRNGLVQSFPDVYYMSTGGDRRLYLLLTEFGKGRVTPDVTSVYRKHHNSLTGSRNSPEKILAARVESIRNAKNWNQYFNNKYNTEYNLVRSKTANQIVIMMLQQKKLLQAIRYSLLIDLDYLSSRRAKKWVHWLKILGNLLKIQAPEI